MGAIRFERGSRAVAIDPLAPTVLYSLTLLSISVALNVPVLTLTGNRFVRTNLPVNLGVPGQPIYLRFASGYGLLLLGRGGQVNRMFLRNMTTGTVTAQPTPNLLPNNASDMVVIGNKAYATSEGDGTAAAVDTIVEWDLMANTDRVVGTGYPPLYAVASFGGSLLAGDGLGNLHLIDPATGASSLLVATALGRINAIATSTTGQVCVIAENPPTWTIHDVFASGPPLFSSSLAIDDLVFGPSQVATMLEFGSGCQGSNGLVPRLGFSAPPALGTQFAVTLGNAPGNGLAAMIFGTSRVADPLGALPRDLGMLGMPNCTQYIDLAGLYGVLASAGGTASLSFTLPPNPLFAGTRVPVQWLCLDAPVNPFGATTSNGGECYMQ